MLQLVASFSIIIYDRTIFIIQATEEGNIERVNKKIFFMHQDGKTGWVFQGPMLQKITVVIYELSY